MKVMAPMSPYGIVQGEPKSIGKIPIGLVWVPNVQSTTLANPDSTAITAVCSMPIGVAPPMSMVEQYVGVMPSSAATRDAQPCCSPICAGMRQSTPSTSSRATPQSSMARLADSRQNAMALTEKRPELQPFFDALGQFVQRKGDTLTVTLTPKRRVTVMDLIDGARRDPLAALLDSYTLDAKTGG